MQDTRYRVYLASAVLNIMHVLYIDTGDRNTGSTPTCPELQQMDRFSFLACDGDEFEEEQCISDSVCFCVDEVTGDRLSDRTRTRAEISCDGKLIYVATSGQSLTQSIGLGPFTFLKH